MKLSIKVTGTAVALVIAGTGAVYLLHPKTVREVLASCKVTQRESPLAEVRGAFFIAPRAYSSSDAQCVLNAFGAPRLESFYALKSATSGGGGGVVFGTGVYSGVKITFSRDVLPTSNLKCKRGSIERFDRGICPTAPKILIEDYSK